MLCYGYEKKVLAVMFDNSTNSHVRQLHKFQKNETTICDVGNPVFGVINGTQLSPLDNRISKENKDINKQIKTLHISVNARSKLITK
jgi:hypothetical protein